MPRHILIVVLAALLSGAAFLLLREPAVGTQAPAPFDPSPLQRQLDELLARQRELERRLQQLGTPAEAAAPQRQEARATPPPAATEDLDRRLAEVEKMVSHLRSVELGIGPMPTELAGVLRALDDKNLYGFDVNAELKRRRMDLRRKLLELAPMDPRASKELLELSNDCVMTQGPKAAIAVLDEFSARVPVPPAQLAMRYAGLYSQAGDGERARAIYDSRIRDATAPEAERADARFWHAYSYYTQGRYDEAARGFEALVAEYGEDPPAALRSSVGGARNYLQKCREHK